jgi:hypothetical protein
MKRLLGEPENIPKGTPSMISPNHALPLSQTPVNSDPVPTSANQPTISEPGAPSSLHAMPDNPRAKGDSELAVLYGNALLRTNGVLSHDKGLMVDIPPSSTFGQWWAQLGRAFQSPLVTEWLNSAGVDKSTLRITPGSNQISFTTRRTLTESPTSQTRGPQNKEWSNVSGPVVAAGVIVANGYGFANFKPPLFESSDSAPLWLVKRFYKEREQASIPATHQRAKEILADEAFQKLDEPHLEWLHESRSEDELATQKATLGFLHDNQNLGNMLKYLAEQQVEYGYWEGRIPQFLKETFLPPHPDSPYAKEPSRSLKKIIDDNGWDMPTNREQLENLSKYLLRAEPSAHEYGNNGGAFAWPIPLDKNSRLQLESDLHYGKFGNIDVSASKNVLEYLMKGETLSQTELRNPQQLLKTLIDSPKGQELGREIQAKFEARSVKGSVEDWLLAAMNMDGYVDAGPPRQPKTIISGFDLMDKQTWGKPAPVIFKQIVDFLFSEGQASSPEKATILAHVLLSNRAPEFLVKDIPEKVVPGTHSWVSFVTAVGRIEAQTPGATAGMSYGQVMIYADVAPISVRERQVEYAAQEKALKNWGIINEMPSDTPERMKKVREAFSAQISELREASEAYSTPMPDLEAMALEELKKFLPHMTEDQLKEKCIVLRLHNMLPHREFPGPYSVLDLYMKNYLVDHPPAPPSIWNDDNDPSGIARAAYVDDHPLADQSKWFSTSAAVDIDDVLKKAEGRPHILPAFKAAIGSYLEDIEKATRVQVKLLISQLPYEDRKNLEYGKITVAKEFDVFKSDSFSPLKRTRMKPNTLVVKTELKNKPVTTYEINLKDSKITKREDHKNFVIGRQPSDSTYIYRDFDEVKPKRYSEDATDEKAITGAYLNSFNSERTAYIADAMLDDLNIKGSYDEAWGSNTFDTEVPEYKKVQEFFLNLIPFRSAIKNFIEGNYGDGIVDLSLDIFGFVMGLGAAIKATKAVAAGAKALTETVRVLKIVGRTAIGALNPLDGVPDIVKGVVKLGKAGFKQSQKAFRTLVNAADSYDLIAASKRFDTSSFGTFKQGNNIAQSPAVMQNGKWHAYNPATGKSYGPALTDFAPSLQKNSDDLAGWGITSNYTPDRVKKIRENWVKAVSGHKNGPEKAAFEAGYNLEKPLNVKGFSKDMNLVQIMELADKNTLSATEIGSLLKQYDDGVHKLTLSRMGNFTNNIEPHFGTVIPLPQAPYFSMTKQLSDGECAAMSYSMLNAMGTGKEKIFMSNMHKAAAFPQAPASREFMEALTEVQKRVTTPTKFHTHQVHRQVTAQKMIAEVAESTTPKTLMIDTPGHAMTIGMNLEGGQKRYFFYDPNFGLATFYSADDMTKGLTKLFNDKKLAGQYKSYNKKNPNILEFRISPYQESWQKITDVFDQHIKKLYDAPINVPDGL